MPKFAVDMPGRDLIVATSHYMRIDADADRIAITQLIAKLLQRRNIIDIDTHL